MRLLKFIKEDVISKALEIKEPIPKQQYDPDIAERYLETLSVAIAKIREKRKSSDYDPEKDVDDPSLEADEAKLKDLQDKYNKWEEIAGADDEAEGEEPADEDPTSDPGEDPGDMEPEEGEEELPPEEEEPEEEEPKKKKKPVEERRTNKLKAIFDIPGRDDPTSLDDPKPRVDPDDKYPLTQNVKREKAERKQDVKQEKDQEKAQATDDKQDKELRMMNARKRAKMKSKPRLIRSPIKKL
jgi:hypothetical protein